MDWSDPLVVVEEISELGEAAEDTMEEEREKP